MSNTENQELVTEIINLPIAKKIIYVDGTINNELFQRIVDFVNEYSDNYLIEIWLNSLGGDCMSTEMIRDIIEECQIPLVGCYFLGSSAFNLFMTANTKKRLVSGTKAIFHKTSISDITIDENFKPMIDSEFKRFLGENYRSVLETVEKIKLTPKQKSKYNKNKDINFTYSELIDIIKSLNDENFIFDFQ